MSDGKNQYALLLKSINDAPVPYSELVGAGEVCREWFWNDFFKVLSKPGDSFEDAYSDWLIEFLKVTNGVTGPNYLSQAPSRPLRERLWMIFGVASQQALP